MEGVLCADETMGRHESSVDASSCRTRSTHLSRNIVSSHIFGLTRRTVSPRLQVVFGDACRAPISTHVIIHPQICIQADVHCGSRSSRNGGYMEQY